MRQCVFNRTIGILSAGILAVILFSQSGCHSILATAVYVVQGGNVVPAEYKGLEGERVVVVCRPPSSHDYHHAGAASSIARQVAMLLRQNVKSIDIVDSEEVDNWADESDWSEFKELGRAVKADKMVYIELDTFGLEKGPTLYQGNSDVTVSVYDMKEGNGKRVYQKGLGELLYPRNSGIDRSKPQNVFQREFEGVISTAIAIQFYKHDPNASFAIDAMANR